MGLCVVGTTIIQGHFHCHHSRLSAGFSIARWTVGTSPVSFNFGPQAAVPSLAPILFRSQMLLCDTASKRGPRPSSYMAYATGSANPGDGSPGLTGGSNMQGLSFPHPCPDIWMHLRSYSVLKEWSVSSLKPQWEWQEKYLGGDICANHGTTKRRS